MCKGSLWARSYFVFFFSLLGTKLSETIQKKVKRYSPARTCNFAHHKLGVQSLQELSYRNPVTMKGKCILWILIIIYLSISNPNVTAKTFMKKIIPDKKFFSKSDYNYFYNVSEGFLKKLNTITIKYYDIPLNELFITPVTTKMEEVVKKATNNFNLMFQRQLNEDDQWEKLLSIQSPTSINTRESDTSSNADLSTAEYLQKKANKKKSNTPSSSNVNVPTTKSSSSSSLPVIIDKKRTSKSNKSKPSSSNDSEQRRKVIKMKEMMEEIKKKKNHDK